MLKAESVVFLAARVGWGCGWCCVWPPGTGPLGKGCQGLEKEVGKPGSEVPTQGPGWQGWALRLPVLPAG